MFDVTQPNATLIFERTNSFSPLRAACYSRYRKDGVSRIYNNDNERSTETSLKLCWKEYCKSVLSGLLVFCRAHGVLDRGAASITDWPYVTGQFLCCAVRVLFISCACECACTFVSFFGLRLCYAQCTCSGSPHNVMHSFT